MKSARQTQIPAQAIALLRIPAFGDDYEVPILTGTDLRDLVAASGTTPTRPSPARSATSPWPVTGSPTASPSRELLELDRGDQIIVETRDAIYTYVLDEPPRDLTVQDTDTWVLDPVPGEPKSKPTKALITLTTCQDLFRSPDRSVGFGHLASTKNKG